MALHQPQVFIKPATNGTLSAPEFRSPTAILAEHAGAIRGLGKRVIGDVIEIGQRLVACKALAGHGNWRGWLEREFGWEETTALRFMRVHELAQSKSGKLPDLPVSGLYLLAAPSTPEAAKTEIIARAEAGEPVSLAAIKCTIAAARNHKQPAKRRRTPDEVAKDKANERAYSCVTYIGTSLDVLDELAFDKLDDPAKLGKELRGLATRLRALAGRIGAAS